jgi:hypothetical protein
MLIPVAKAFHESARVVTRNDLSLANRVAQSSISAADG